MDEQHSSTPFPPTRGGFTWTGDVGPEALEAIARLYEGIDAPDYGAMPYQEYLKTEWWQELRRSKVRAAGFRCQRCDVSGYDGHKLDVHHLTYERLGREMREDLIVLCRGCHEAEHGIRRLGR